MRPELLILRASLEADAAGAEADLHAALAEAEQQGALTVALRAAAQLALRGTGADEPAARAALAVIDGGDTSALPADWVARQLDALRPQSLAAA